SRPCCTCSRPLLAHRDRPDIASGIGGSPNTPAGSSDPVRGGRISPQTDASGNSRLAQFASCSVHSRELPSMSVRRTAHELGPVRPSEGAAFFHLRARGLDAGSPALLGEGSCIAGVNV